MKHEESYYGHRVVVTTTQNASGRWTSTIDVPGAGPESTHGGEASGGEFPSEEEARQAALSRAAGIIDRARQNQGKR